MTHHSIELTWKQLQDNKVPTKIEILKSDGPNDVYRKVGE